ncbi:competence protein ComEC family protein [Zhouia spongiae]|uniref:Competence protein ComEC family protein n=1 Tax=Zhouia spongiae TaxID=2202721 RepID=A0ABY3YUI8_9FLAO|nr:ComEC/Rec2 family competence protein [Zhouia spongiae]UNZ00159.1 competence protein ComEC family protein [Zhouia spongiae]
MKLLNFIPIRLTALLIAGILTGYSLFIPLSYIAGVLVSLFIIYTFTYIKGRKRSLLFSILSYLIIYLIGYLSIYLSNPKNSSIYFERLIVTRQDNTFILKIKSSLKSNDNYSRLEAEVTGINETKSTGSLVVNIKKDFNTVNLKPDDLIYTKITPQKVKPPLNPHQFNYKEHLKKKLIHHQLYLQEGEYIVKPQEPSSIVGLAHAVRKKIQTSLETQTFEPEVLAILNALLLGERKGISSETYADYANAGAIHILAISGLHIGILLLILHTVFGPLARYKHGKTIKLFLIILILWGYAVIAGLSPSVVRAVTMFSFLAYAWHRKRPAGTYNIIAISIFFLLLFRPVFIFDVGFQLSYTAVLFIVWLQPLLYRLLRFKWKLADYFWKLSSVSLAAQIGVAPLGLYYFHQFPGLFFVSNLVIIPLLGVIIGGGILIIVLSLLNLLPPSLVIIYNTLIQAMNDFVKWISQQETFIFKDIPFNLYLIITTYLMIIGIILFLINLQNKKKTLRYCPVLIASVFLLFFSFNQTHTERFIIFHKSRNTLLAIQNDSLTVYTNNRNASESLVSGYSLGENISNTVYLPIRNEYRFKNETIIVIDSTSQYISDQPSSPIILLTQSPKIHLSRAIDSLNPKLIIADGSNYKSYIERWEETCTKEKLPFHYTGEKGAYIIE